MNCARVCILIILILSIVSYTPVSLAAEPSMALQAIERAENDVKSAYDMVSQAEQAGANISVLADKLDKSADLLATARNAYSIGDYENATLTAEQCSDSAIELVSEATALKTQATEAYNARLFINGASASVGLSVLFVLSLFFWRVLRKRYLDRILKMTPNLGEVSHDA